ncbi:hypothetical protein [Haloarchaeobius sp. DFWS5]|uniref:hypothetical protein n=1 Tax=Haloarchaeobius sp. DFWS5 TaxID=3446114 RepID=UPI003EB8C414
MNRRTALSLLTSSLTLLAGCTAVDRSDDPANTDEADANPGKPVAGAAEPISTTATVDRDSLDYLDDTDEIRYVARRRGGEPVYESLPFDQWGDIETAHVGASAVSERLSAETPGLSTGVSTVERRKRLVVGYHGDDRAAFDRVVAQTPRAVTTTVSFAGREYSGTHPVVVARTREVAADYAERRGREVALSR